MASPFAITAPTTAVQLDTSRNGEAVFTVSNTTGKALRGRARVTPVDAAAAAWFTLAEPVEHDFGVNETHPYSVKIQAPPGASPGSQSFRLDVVGVENPDELFTQGPSVTATLSALPVVVKAKFPWWIVAVVVAVLVVGGGVGFWLTQRNVTVPDLTNRPSTEVEQALRDANLRLGATTEQDTGGAPGTVVQQSLAAGTKASRGSAIDIVVVSSTIPVPSVQSLSVDAARTVLEQAGLSLGATTEKVSGGAPGSVLAQTPAVGARVAPGDVVDVEIEAPTVKVPNLQLLPIDQARQELENVRLSLGDTSEEATGQVAGTVLKQDPGPGSDVRRDTAVNLVIEPAPVQVPDVEGLNVEQARTELTDAGLTPGATTEEATGTKAAGTVLEQSKLPGSSVLRGTVVDLVIEPAPVKVPAVVGLDVLAATNAITSTGLQVGQQTNRRSRTDKPGIVLEQTPGANDPTIQGGMVELVLAIEPDIQTVGGLVLIPGGSADLDGANTDDVRNAGGIAPQNAAKAAVMGTTAPGYLGCAQASYSAAEIDRASIPIGTYVCVRTSEDRYSEILITPSSGFIIFGTLAATYRTWNKPDDECSTFMICRIQILPLLPLLDDPGLGN